MSKTILLIDDDEVQRAALRKIIEAEPGWRLVEASDGQEGLDKLCDGLRPQLCLIDLVMPKICGVELLYRIRRDPDLRSLKAMVTSGSRDRETIVELARLQIEGYLLKPFDLEKTLAMLRTTLALVPDPDIGKEPPKNILGKTALVVEDDPVCRKVLDTIIRHEPLWDIVEASDGEEALARLRGGLKPHLSLIDLEMPKLDGTTLISMLRADPQFNHLRVAVISADQDREKIRALAKLRIDAYLLKPLNAAKVQSVLRAAAPV